MRNSDSPTPKMGDKSRFWALNFRQLRRNHQNHVFSGFIGLFGLSPQVPKEKGLGDPIFGPFHHIAFESGARTTSAGCPDPSNLGVGQDPKSRGLDYFSRRNLLLFVALLCLLCLHCLLRGQLFCWFTPKTKELSRNKWSYRFPNLKNHFPRSPHFPK